MEQRKSDKILYTVQYLNSISSGLATAHPAYATSQNEPPLELGLAHQRDGATPIIEIVTAIDVVNGGSVELTEDKLDKRHLNHIEETYMIIHSEILSRLIRETVQFYAGQNLTGTSLTIREPYACLMHHMDDFEHLAGSAEDDSKVEHIRVLLEFLRPRYQQRYVPAKQRCKVAQPTVMFHDLWVVMRPGALAYTCWGGHKIGCVIGKSIRLPPNLSHDLPERWSIDFWCLQVHWPSDQIGCIVKTAVIDRFDGERLIGSLSIYPIEFLEDQGRTKQRFIDRGRKVCDLLWGDSMYMEYDGECVDHLKQRYTGRIVCPLEQNQGQNKP
ncbi:hypothetical protein F4777DRAFT_376705 [Nemania sp. FL0916]|nr:hypothetical protein F4777DRAFT_376705 [Nemania sp. FL0916]